MVGNILPITFKKPNRNLFNWQMKFLIILSLLYLVLSQAPKGRFINISVNNTHAIGKVDGLNSTSTFYFSVPKPRRECSNSVPCYVVGRGFFF